MGEDEASLDKSPKSSQRGSGAGSPGSSFGASSDKFKPPERTKLFAAVGEGLTTDAKVETKLFTATVGRKVTKAKYFVQNVEEVSDLLHRLAQQSISASFSRYTSMP